VLSVRYMHNYGELKMIVSKSDVYNTLTELIVVSEEDGYVYIFNFATGKEFETNETGKEILDLCHNRQVIEIAEILAKNHGMDQDIVLKDVKLFIEEALKETLVKKVEKNE